MTGHQYRCSEVMTWKNQRWRSEMLVVFSPGYDLTHRPQLRIAPAARGSPRIYNFMVQTVINRLSI